MSKQRVVIVGGGFGGVKVALDLASDRRFHITLITDHTDFRYYPTMYRTATGGRRMISSIPLEEIFEGKSVQILQDKTVKVDRQKQLIITKVNHEIGYDSLVLALGVQTNYFNISGLKKLSYGIKTPDDAEALKNHLHKQLIDEKKPDLNYVVIGGGPTGIELAGALPSYVRHIMHQHQLSNRAVHVDLVEAAPRLVPKMPKDMSKSIARRLRRIGVKLYLDTAVQAQTADALMIGDKAIRSHTVIWTAGVTNNPFFVKNDFQLTHSGKVRVDQYLQCDPGIYVIGDNADTPYSGLAQTALYDAGFVATNLVRLADKKDCNTYKAKRPIYVLPAGPHWAAVLWGRVRIYGRLGWLLRSLADLVAYHDYEPWKLATHRWAAVEDDEENCLICAERSG